MRDDGFAGDGLGVWKFGECRRALKIGKWVEGWRIHLKRSRARFYSSALTWLWSWPEIFSLNIQGIRCYDYSGALNIYRDFGKWFLLMSS